MGLGLLTLGKTPLDEWSALRRDLYLTTHITDKRHPRHVAIEAAIPTSEWPQNHTLDGAAIGIGWKSAYCKGKHRSLITCHWGDWSRTSPLNKWLTDKLLYATQFYVASKDIWNEKTSFKPWRHPSLCCEGHFCNCSYYYQFIFISHDVGTHTKLCMYLYAYLLII